MTNSDMVAAARSVADAVLFPDALVVDTADRVPETHFEALAEAGLWGVAATLPLDEFCAVIEALASGCLATAFVWIQHHRLVRDLMVDDTPVHLRDQFLDALMTGRMRSGIALAGLHPGPPRLVATPDEDGGYIVRGDAPWVTGWGLIDVLHVAARSPAGDEVVYVVLDATDQPGLTAARQRLVAVDASCTVELRFDGLRVPGDRVLRTTPFDEDTFSGGGGLRVNGSLALGGIDRCCRLIGPSPLDDELAAVRARLDRSPPHAMFEARAAASELAMRAANALVVHDGSRSITTDAHGQRLAREALFLAVFGTRPQIRSSLLDQLFRK